MTLFWKVCQSGESEEQRWASGMCLEDFRQEDVRGLSLYAPDSLHHAPQSHTAWGRKWEGACCGSVSNTKHLFNVSLIGY